MCLHEVSLHTYTSWLRRASAPLPNRTYLSEADLLKLYIGSKVVDMSNAVTVQKHSNGSSHLGVDVCPATNALHHSFASRMHGQHLPNPLTLRRGRRAVMLLSLMVQLRGQYSLKK